MPPVKLRILSSVLAVSLICAGCASSINPKQRSFERKLDVVTNSATPAGMDPIATAAFWGTRYDRAPTDPVAVVNFSKSLRAIGNNAESLRVMQHSNSRVDNDADILLELGKSLIANDRPHEAVRHLQSAIVLGKSEDWSAYSSLGVALDRTGDHRQAIIQYDRALAIAPDQPQVLNNKGLSYALAGRRELAKRTLRTATSMPGGTAQIRQNYALVLALSGDASSAERLARSDLPPAIADGNVAYYQSLVAQPAYWQGLDGDNAVQPDFGDDPASISTTPVASPVRNPDGPAPAQPRRTPAPTPTVPNPQSTPATVPSPAAAAATGGTESEAVAAPATGAPEKLSYED